MNQNNNNNNNLIHSVLNISSVVYSCGTRTKNKWKIKVEIIGRKIMYRGDQG